MNMGELFTLKYKDIHSSARNIGRKRAPDLINSTYLELSKVEHPSDPEHFLKWFCKGMKLRYGYSKSNFNQLATSKALETVEIIQEEEPTPIKDKSFESLIKFKKSLPLHEQLIFDLYFINGLSGYDITDQLNQEGYSIHRKRVNGWVLTIKNKLDKWKKQM